MTVRIINADCREGLRSLPDASVQVCVTSPPYYGLRDYGHDGQIGLETSPDEFVSQLVDVFREVRRVLRDDGTLWLNIGDSYAAQRGGSHQPAETLAGGKGGRMADGAIVNRDRHAGYNPTRNAAAIGLKHKDLIGIPWMLAFALRADGWYLRQDIIWHKPNPMPESVRDRCTKAHEYIFLLSKAEKYFFDDEAIKEKAVSVSGGGFSQKYAEAQPTHGAMQLNRPDTNGLRNKRDVWSVPVRSYNGAHFATFPPALVEPCILAGSSEGDVVLDPFGGAGTTGLVADRLQRDAILIELNPEYAALARLRITADAPLLAAS